MRAASESGTPDAQYPAQVGEGMTGACANDRVTKEDLDQILAITNSFGRTEVVPERLMDAVGAVSGAPPHMFLCSLKQWQTQQSHRECQESRLISLPPSLYLEVPRWFWELACIRANLKTWSAPRPELPLKASAPLRKTASAAPYSKHSRQHLIKENKCNP